MAPKQSPQGAPSAARLQGSQQGAASAVSDRDDGFLRGGKLLLPLWGETSHSHLQLKVFLTFLKLYFVFGQTPLPRDSETVFHLLHSWIPHFLQVTYRPLMLSQVILLGFEDP